MGALLQSVALNRLNSTGAVNEVVLCPCRVNLWCHGACPTRQTGTMAGGACLGGWTGMGTSRPPRLIPRLVARQIHVSSRDTFATKPTKLSSPAGAWTPPTMTIQPCRASPGSCLSNSFEDSCLTQHLERQPCGYVCCCHQLHHSLLTSVLLDCSPWARSGRCSTQSRTASSVCGSVRVRRWACCA